jgi:putative solute:sodium symporter small subunit
VARDRAAPSTVAGPEGEPQPSRLLEFQEQTEVGSVYLQALMRRQLRLSLTLALIFVGFLFIQPLISTWIPQWAALRLGGVPLPWLILGIGSYPILIWLGLVYVRRAEEVDDEFTDLLS